MEYINLNDHAIRSFTLFPTTTSCSSSFMKLRVRTVGL